MLQWFNRSAVSDETADWLAECFSWAMQNFDVTHFANTTALVLPTNAFFPHPVASSDGMAQYVFDRVIAFSGLKTWPWRLDPPECFVAQAPPLLGLNPEVRGEDTVNILPVEGAEYLSMTYARDQVAKPQDLVATLAHGVAQHMLWQSQLTPPGGTSYFLQAAEVLAVYMGFGVMIANSAYSFRGSCARCYNPRANRQASLSESECVYALALFCDLQKIDRRDVAKHLKKYLNPALKSAFRQVDRHPGTPHLRALCK
ncbi:MAG TPA: hypothetical protein VIC26_16600 [Marinagarivorans sp.]